MNSKAFFGGVVVSPEADIVARELIHELHIPKLHNLAFLLEINKCFAVTRVSMLGDHRSIY